MKDAETDAIVTPFAAIVTRDDDGNLSLKKLAGWVAIPVESRAHLTAHQIEKLIGAWNCAGNDPVVAVLLEPLTGIDKTSNLRLSQEDFSRFNNEYAHFNVALYAHSPQSVAICTTDDFAVIAGPEEFVSKVVGAIPEAYAKFLSFLSADGFDERARDFFMSVLVSLRDTYVRLDVDESVVFLRRLPSVPSA